MHILDFYRDILLSVVHHLCYVDYMALKFTCKKLHIGMRDMKDFKRIFINKLAKNFTLKCAVELCTTLQSTKSMVSGSSILDCLYDTEHRNDIDIYTVSDDIYRKMVSHGFINRIEVVDSSGYMHFATNYCMDEEDKTIQIIQVPPATLVRNPVVTFITSAYDMDLVMNGYDGQTLYIKNWNVLFNRSDFIRPSMGLLFRHNVEYYKENTNTRLAKYRERGFDIAKHPKYDDMFEKIISMDKVDTVDEMMTTAMVFPCII